MKTTNLIRIPWVFALDHGGRSLPLPEIVKRTQSHWWIKADDPALPELLNDAEYYAHPYGPEAYGCIAGLKASARATVRAIRDVIGWDDAEPEIKALRRPVS